MVGGNTFTSSASAVNYNGLQSASSWNAAENKVYSPIPSAGTLSNLHVMLNNAPGTGTSYSFKLVKNGVATSLTATVSDTNTTAADIVDTVSVSPGDTVSIQCTPTGTPAAAPPRWSMSFAPNNDGESFFLYGDNASPSTTVTQYEQPLGRASAGWNSAAANQIMRLQSGTMKAIYVLLTAAPGGTTSYAIGVQQNGVTTALTTIISGSNTTANTSTIVPVANDDSFNLVSTPSGTTPASTSVHTGILFSTATPVAGLSLLGVG